MKQIHNPCPAKVKRGVAGCLNSLWEIRNLVALAMSVLFWEMWWCEEKKCHCNLQYFREVEAAYGGCRFYAL